MKKMNNKGFAISTLLYGLMLVGFLTVSLLMSIMASNRRNSSSLVKKIERELNKYREITTEFYPVDYAQVYVVPEGHSGWYKIQLWGAAAYGVDSSNETSSGRGSYTSGIIYLTEGQELYFHVGNTPSSTTETAYNANKAGIGGATEVRFIEGVWNDTESLSGRIMVAGSGGESAFGYGYSSGFKNSQYSGGSYISGYGGQVSVDADGDGKLDNFLSSTMFLDVNASEGKAKIEKISSNAITNPPISRPNNNLTGISTIRDCVTIDSSSKPAGGELWKEIQAYDINGNNIALESKALYPGNSSTQTEIPGIIDGKISAITSSNLSTKTIGTKCVDIQFTSQKNIEEIVIFHSKTGSSPFLSENIQVYRSGGYHSVMNSLTTDSNGTPTETTLGIRISSGDISLEEEIPAGTYYLLPEVSSNRAVTAKAQNEIRQLLFTGNNNQKWVIKENNGSYVIYESAEKGILQPENGGAEDGEKVSIDTTYDAEKAPKDWEKWNLEALDNGYYQLKSNANSSLCLSVDTTEREQNTQLVVKTCINAASTNVSEWRSQWFKLKNANY